MNAPGANGPNWAFRDAAVAYLQRERPLCVVLVARWSGLMTWNCSSGGKTASTAPEREQCLAKALSETIATILNAGVERVWILGEVPSQRFNVPKQLALHELFGWQDVRSVSEAEFVTVTAPVAQLFQRLVNDRVSYLDVAVLLRQASENSLMVDGACAYSDDNHISASAARALAPYLAPLFDELSSSHGRAPQAAEGD
jgi:hypothetical protein